MSTLPPQRAALLGALGLGPLMHYAIWVRFEVDNLPWIPLVASVQLLLPIYLHYLGLSALRAAFSSLVLQSVYIASTFTSIAIYRLFLHPCRIFPGPFWARLWTFWRVKAFIDEGDRGYLVLHKLHQKYGDAVRVGPRQISINHVDGIYGIYGSGSVCTRSVHSDLRHKQDLQSLRDKARHKKERQVWDQAMNGKACASYMPRMVRTIDTWVDKVRSYDGSPISVNDWCHFITFDLMGDIGLGKSFRQIEDAKIHCAVEAVQGSLKFAVTATQLAWLFNIIFDVPGLPKPVYGLGALCKKALEERELEEPEERDILSYIDLQQHLKSNRRALLDNVRILTIAATDTTYSALVYLLNYLARDPDLQARLRAEVLPAYDNNPAGPPHWPTLQSLPLFDSIISETLRMHPPTMQGLTRGLPEDQGAMIGPFWVPAGTHLSAPTWSLHHDPRYFEKPDEWIPERWTSRPELVKDRRAYIPFSVGPTSCAGKYFALQEMKTFISKVVMNFEIGFEKGEDGSRLLTDFRDHFTTWLPETKMTFVPLEVGKAKERKERRKRT